MVHFIVLRKPHHRQSSTTFPAIMMLLSITFCFACLKEGLDSQSNSSKLAISMLISNPRENDTEFSFLKASISLLCRNLMPYTPSVIFVFTLKYHVEAIQASIQHINSSLHNVAVVVIPSSQWAVPDRVSNQSLWRLKTRFPWGYRMMGEWRLAHQMR